MVTEVHPAHLTQLIRALAVLALPFEDQSVWLSSLGLPEPLRIVDELALEFDDVVRLSGSGRSARCAPLKSGSVYVFWLEPPCIRCSCGQGQPSAAPGVARQPPTTPPSSLVMTIVAERGRPVAL